MKTGPDTDLHELAAEHLQRVREANRRFFEAETEPLSWACRDMARRFARGGRLLVCGDGKSESDADHVAVEFLHPVLVGKRALPAMVLESHATDKILLIGRSQDIAMGIAATDCPDSCIAALLETAKAAGLLTIGLAGAEGMTGARPDYLFRIPSDDPLVVQEVQETCYHVLYELVHVFLEHEEQP